MNIIVLAAGKGTRMKSTLPKVLHPLADKPLLGHVLDCARSLSPTRLIVVYGHGGEMVQQVMGADDLRWALQEPQHGTGHAVMQAVPELDDSVPTLVLYGDVPLTRAESLTRLMQACDNQHLAVLTMTMDNPTGYGRIVRDNGRVTRIVEQKDATPAQLTIDEINTGILAAPTAPLKRWLAGLSNDNAQQEYYLTDIVAAAVADGISVNTASPDFPWEADGVNSKLQLADLERTFQRDQARQLMEQGVHVMDPNRIDIRGSLTCEQDVVIDVNCIFEATVSIGAGARIGANCIIRDSVIEAGAQILPFTHIDSARVGQDARIGPYARLRPGTVLAQDTHVGNFVEMKNTQMGAGSKANHLAYVGDAQVGQRVNIGAGTITCNYDGANKFKTIIEDDAFIGSDTQLVAPVTVGKGATLGAGTTLSKDAPANQLTISRPPQITIEGWQRPVKKKPV
ncbi:MAG: bifunctional UDP-N-acetylglucosamine diphosphorylase/glucosamine-1-phosphate N-acetyltransferase GlmU [Burkholderiaceae bacterium]